MGKNKKSWGEMPWWQKVLTVNLTMIQLGLFAIAWIDLSRREPDQVNGSKLLWRAALFINYVGPIAYLTKGRK